MWKAQHLTITVSVLVVITGVTSQPKNSESEIQFAWNSILPFYIDDVLQKLDGLELPQVEVKLLNGVTRPCKDASSPWIAQLLNRTLHPSTHPSWVIQLINSWGRPQNGFSDELWKGEAVGDFDQCVSTRGSLQNGNTLQGKYCLSTVTHPGQTYSIKNARSWTLDFKDLSSMPTLGTCIPSSCTNEDSDVIIRNILRQLGMQDSLSISNVDCYTQDYVPLVAGDIVMLIVFAAIILLVFIGTVYESTLKPVAFPNETIRERILVSFSLKKNIHILLKSNSQAEELSCLNGIKFLTVAWIVLSQTWEICYRKFYYSNPNKVDYRDWSTLLIVNSDVAVDTLFLISGLTLAYSLLSEIDKYGGRIVGIFYLKRILRFTPAYGVIVGLMATFYRFFSSGPYFTVISHLSENCKINWWTNMLYVNNFVNSTLSSMCITSSWYFSNEMQFIVLSPLVLFPLWKFAKGGYAVTILLTIASVVVPGIISHSKSLNSLTIPIRRDDDLFDEFYIKPWNRASPFLIGLIGGYVIYAVFAKLPSKKIIIVSGWVCSTAVALTIIFGIYPYMDLSQTISLEQVAIYNALHRFAWSIVIFWIILACSKQCGGWINTILSCKVFYPFSRASTIAYLISLPVQGILHFRFRMIIFPDKYTVVNLFIADLILTYFISLILTLIIDLPSAQLDFECTKSMKKVDEDFSMMVMPPRERYGIFYDKQVSISIGNGRRRIQASQQVENDMRPVRQRFGIFYDQNISLPMKLSNDVYKKG